MDHRAALSWLTTMVHLFLNPTNNTEVRSMVDELLDKGTATPINEADLLFRGDE